MSGYPVILDGERLRALVVGGGQVAARRIRALLDAGAHVRVVAPEIHPEISALQDGGRVKCVATEYDPATMEDANIVFAATDSTDVNAAVAADARRRGIIVNVASEAGESDFFVPAAHRDEQLLVAVYTAGVPSAAARIRDAIASALGGGLGAAVARLARMRRARLDAGDAAGWSAASRELIADDFVASVSSGEFDRRLERWA